MEILKGSPTVVKRNLISFANAEEMWRYALDYVTSHRKKELEEIWSGITRAHDNLNERFFMREYVWVVHVSGFSAKVVSKLHPRLLIAHQIEDERGRYLPIKRILEGDDLKPVFAVCKNRNKAKAIQKVRGLLLELGWDNFCKKYVQMTDFGHGILVGPDSESLRQLPFMGPALSCHLSRNLGNTDAVKPDLHLIRLAKVYGFDSAFLLCTSLARGSLYRGYVDLVLWMASVDCGTGPT
jgi:hypothetical protein